MGLVRRKRERPDVVGDDLPGLLGSRLDGRKIIQIISPDLISIGIGVNPFVGAGRVVAPPTPVEGVRRVMQRSIRRAFAITIFAQSVAPEKENGSCAGDQYHSTHFSTGAVDFVGTAPATERGMVAGVI